ncbi:MAG: hypothetical protein JRH15_22845 [Deltaproteobacteria bacterium]|nr:hypothetical protein [Deltaproteobacteria bacterium]
MIAALPNKAASLDVAARVNHHLHPFLSVDRCRHITTYGYRETVDGSYEPKYDTRMAMQSLAGGGAIENLWDLARSVPCLDSGGAGKPIFNAQGN